MTKDPKITMDTVRLALALSPNMRADAPDYVMLVMRDAAELERIGRRVKALNTQYANTGAESVDKAADRAAMAADEIATRYGALFSRYGRGSGLWPLVCVDGKDFSL